MYTINLYNYIDDKIIHYNRKITNCIILKIIDGKLWEKFLVNLKYFTY